MCDELEYIARNSNGSI